MLFRTQIIFCSSELRLHFRIAEVGSLLSLDRAWRAQVTSIPKRVIQNSRNCGTSTTWAGSSGVRPDARQSDGSRSLSLKFQLGTLAIELRSAILHHEFPTLSMSPKGTIYPKPTNGVN